MASSAHAPSWPKQSHLRPHRKNGRRPQSDWINPWPYAAFIPSLGPQAYGMGTHRERGGIKKETPHCEIATGRFNSLLRIAQDALTLRLRLQRLTRHRPDLLRLVQQGLQRLLPQRGPPQSPCCHARLRCGEHAVSRRLCPQGSSDPR